MLSGCTDWLEVDPIDKILEDQVFDKESTVQNALNGIYIRMAEGDSYGNDLTQRIVELVGQRYYVTQSVSTHSNANVNMKYYMVSGNYTVKSARDRIDAIWVRGYNTILGVNTFIARLENTENSIVITPSKKDILLGEAYGLRAFLHLDMLRLFGPVYSTDSTGIAIPYYTKAEVGYHARLAATEVMDKIMTDIDKSITLLKNDPVRTEGVMTAIEDSLTTSQKEIDPFYRHRNLRMNYYAVNTLKVRALMYRDNKVAAANLAKSLIKSGELTEQFPWAKYSDIFETRKEDFVFTSEVMFGIHSYDMYVNWNDYYNPGITDQNVIYAFAVSNLKKIFDVEGTDLETSPDVRSKFYTPWTPLQVTDGGEPRMGSKKFARTTSTTNVTYFQPLIRKAELFYAIAEADKDVAYLDSVRLNRNLKRVQEAKPIYDLDTEITNEYMREFPGEGQLFYYYKRRYLTSVLNGTAPSTGPANVSMTKARYILPIPQAELDK